ncbi:MAG: MFS transporter [Actinomycetota bacterium]|nr:MAG: MFS transporter [Actinomycetota bacterium]
MIGVLMVAVDTTIVVLALPVIQKSLHVALSAVIWVIIGYLLTITLVSAQVGRLGDMFGRVKMYEAGFLIFIVGSALCALANNEATIIGFRIVQGLGGSLVMANSGAVIADTFPPNRLGRAYGFNSVGYTVGAILGILLGGVIVTYLSWRWIFWVNVPLGIVAYLLALRVLHDSGKREKQRLDLAGMVFLGLGLFGVLWGITKLSTDPFSAEILTYLVGGLLVLVVFVVVERHRVAPMVNLAIFKIPTMTPTLTAAFLQGLANYAVLFLVIMYLQGVRQYSPLGASMLLVPGYVIGSFIGPWSGKLSDRFGAVIPATLGLAIQVIALIVYAQMGTGTAMWLVVAASVINGIGASAFFPANNSAVMKAAPREMFGIASGMLRTFSNVGMVFSFAVAILVAARSIPRNLAFAIFVGTTQLTSKLAAVFTSGLHSAFYASVIIMAFAALLSATRVLRRGSSRTAAKN